MAAIYLRKTSGVLSITQTTGYAKYYGATQISSVKFNALPDGGGVLIYIGGDSYSIATSDLRVNDQQPANITVALVLLNSIFGT